MSEKNNTEYHKNTENLNKQSVNFNNYNKQDDSQYDSSDNNYNAMIEQNKSSTIAPKKINVTIGITDCKFLLDFGSGCTVINLSLAKNNMFNCFQAQLSEKKNTRA